MIYQDEEIQLTGASECSLDFTNVFTTDMIFRSRENLIQWTREVGRRHGLVIVIKTSDTGGDGRKPRIVLSCERSGSYKGPSKVSEKRNPTKATGTKKCNCPFALKGWKLANDGDWMLTVVCGVHNHPNAEHLEGHSFAGRLSEEEINVLIDMSKSLVKPRNILRTLQEWDVHNTSTMKSIYNARQKWRVTELAGRSQMQQLMMHLEQNNYVEYHTSNESTDAMMDLFWAHPSCIQLLRAFPEVLIMDCTYKTNRYRLPLLEIVGVTSTQLTFSVAFVYLASEREANYRWALERLKELLDGCIMPRVIVTDRELSLMNAIKVVFPNAASLLCRWHISRNILANCKKYFETNDRWDAFISCWNMLVLCPTENDYIQLLSALERNFCGYPHVVEYVKNSWLNNHKEQFVAAWTDRHMHFGNLTTNRAESAHAKLKRHLGTSNCSLDASWQVIHALLELLFTEIKASFEKSMNTVQHKFKPALFRELRGFISRSAMDIVLTESIRAGCIGPDSVACGCVIRRTHGLPCAHEIAEYIREGTQIPLSSVNQYWKKLDLKSTKVDEAPELTTTAEFELINRKFQGCDEAGKIQILKKLRELGCPSSTSLLEPDVKLNTRGRSSSKKKKSDQSTRREPSAFEYALSVEDSVSARSNSVEVGKRKEKLGVRRTRSCTFAHDLPKSLGPYIETIKDVEADGNCGFRAIAGLMGMGEDNWMQVRLDLSNELQGHQNYYSLVYGGDDRVGELYYALAYYDSHSPFARWMTMPDIGHLISSYYNVVLVHLSIQQCLTFLPLRSSPIPSCKRKLIAIGFVNGNHFVQVFMTPDAPMPPIATNWCRHHHPDADGWQLPYAHSIEQFKEMIGSSVATTESINLDSD